MTGTHVVTVGRLRAELDSALREKFDARGLDELDAEQASRATVAVTSGVWGVRAEHLDRLPELGAIVNFGVGYDSTDVAEATRRGVRVANTPDVLTDCVADLAVGLVIDVMRGISRADRCVRRDDWAAGQALGRRVSGSRVGIVGLGRIGQAIAHRLEAFGASVGYHNRRPRADVAHSYVPSVLELAQRSDVLILAAAGGPASRHLVDAAVFDARRTATSSRPGAACAVHSPGRG